MAAPIIITLGGALLRIASKQLPKYLDKGAKLLKKPTKSQIEKAKSPRSVSGKAKEKTKTKEPKKRSKYDLPRDEAEQAVDLAEFEMDFGPDPDDKYTPDFSMDRFHKSGGSVKGRPAKRSAENS